MMMAPRRFRKQVIPLLACFFGLPCLWAKPMLAPTLEEAVKVRHIIVCEYQGFDKTGPNTYMGGAIADYKVGVSLKGARLPEKIRVHYAFHDGSACLEPQELGKFSENWLPKPGTSWLLFLTPVKDPKCGFITYRGDFGRLAATPENLKRVKKLIADQQPPQGGNSTGK